MTRRIHVMLASAALVGLGACAQSPRQIALASGAGTRLSTQEITAELKIEAFVSGERLGMSERDAVRFFAAAYQDEGYGALIISRPSNGPDDVAALRAAADARAVLLAEGIDALRISEGPYDASGAAAAPLVLRYQTLEVVTPACPDLSSINFAWTGTNSTLPSFGCATASNLAAMISDPSDLLGDQVMDPSDTARRAIILSKYRNGEATGAARPDGASGAISGALGN